jgi:hypothetical protein
MTSVNVDDYTSDDEVKDLEGLRELCGSPEQPIQSTTISLSMLGARCFHSVYRWI